MPKLNSMTFVGSKIRHTVFKDMSLDSNSIMTASTETRLCRYRVCIPCIYVVMGYVLTVLIELTICNS